MLDDAENKITPEKVQEKEKPEQQHGILVLNKPKGPSSAACIGMIKRRLGQKKIGHAGTLDPMASGVLLVLLGQGTKVSGALLEGGKKTYGATIEFGLKTDTWDAEGEVLDRISPEKLEPMLPNEEDLKSEIESWLGQSEQEVPAFSAAKHNGQPLYKLARKGMETPVKKKIIEISRAELEWFRPPLARFRVACSSGTYIRSLAHSLGIRFGCGATLIELTREYSHPFGLEDAVGLNELLESPQLLRQKVHGINKALPGVPVFELKAKQVAQVKNGTALLTSELAFQPALNVGITAQDLVEAKKALFQDEEKTPVALVEKRELRGKEFWAVSRGLWNN